jgi:hypothetical protein
MRAVIERTRVQESCEVAMALPVNGGDFDGLYNRARTRWVQQGNSEGQEHDDTFTITSNGEELVISWKRHDVVRPEIRVLPARVTEVLETDGY